MNDGTLTKSPYASHSSTADNRLTDKVGEVKDKVGEIKDKMSEVKDTVVEVKDTVIDRGNAIMKKVRGFATANPLKAIAIAFAVGYFGMRVTRPLRWL